MSLAPLKIHSTSVDIAVIPSIFIFLALGVWGVDSMLMEWSWMVVR